jgi:hypothetical protein
MKYLLVASLVILSINVTKAQTKLGIKLNPGIIHQRISFQNDSATIQGGPNAVNLSAMLFSDFPIGQNYYFATGVGYISKRVNLVARQDGDISAQPKSYNIQYVQIPATIKLFTNEIALDKRLYMQFGPLFEIVLNNKETNPQMSVVREFQPLDISLIFATGIEIQLAPQTALMLGFNYTRGLVNIAKATETAFNGLNIKNDSYSIELVLKF